ncbi:MAG: hypothetical protein ACK5Q5_08330 [Planctomycetaceae bacterium]
MSSDSLQSHAKSDHDPTESVILVAYPKIVFLWPSYVVSVIAALYLHIANGSLVAIDTAGGAGAAIGWTFLILLSVNLVVLSFDFPRTTSLTLFFVIVAVALGSALAVVYFPNIFPRVREMLASIRPQANATFYYIFAAVMTMIYIGVLANRRFDYWEVRPNELLHHHGFLSDLKRYSSPNMKIDKEINDIFEYLLLGSGRLIMHPSNEPRAIVLDNVPFISQKERRITKLLGALQVQVRDDS